MERRNTIQRELVLEAVRTLKSHASADEIYGFIKKMHPSIGKGTVYRNLKLLSESGEIRKIMLPEGSDRYDHTLGNHYHVCCVKCGKLFDVDVDNLPDIKANIADAHGMDIMDFDILFRGVCSGCKAKQP